MRCWHINLKLPHNNINNSRDISILSSEASHRCVRTVTEKCSVRLVHAVNISLLIWRYLLTEMIWYWTSPLHINAVGWWFRRENVKSWFPPLQSSTPHRLGVLWTDGTYHQWARLGAERGVALTNIPYPFYLCKLWGDPLSSVKHLRS